MSKISMAIAFLGISYLSSFIPLMLWDSIGEQSLPWGLNHDFVSDVKYDELQKVLNGIEQECPTAKILKIEQCYYYLQIKLAGDGKDQENRILCYYYGGSSQGQDKWDLRKSQPGSASSQGANPSEINEVLKKLVNENPPIPKGNMIIEAKGNCISVNISNPKDPFDREFYTKEFRKIEGNTSSAVEVAVHGNSLTRRPLVHYHYFTFFYCWIYTLLFLMLPYVIIRSNRLFWKGISLDGRILREIQFRLLMFKGLTLFFCVMLCINGRSFLLFIIYWLTKLNHDPEWILSYDFYSYPLKSIFYGFCLLFLAICTIVVMDFMVWKKSKVKAEY